MIRKLTFIMILAALGLSAGSASALFDEPVINPRARAMGEASVSVTDQAYAAFINPGQLGSVSRSEVAASYVQPFGASFHDFFYVGVAIPVHEKYGNIGIGFSSYKVEFFDDELKRDVDLEKETQLTLAHGFKLYNDIHSRVDFGYALNVYNVEFGETITGLDPGNASVVGIDLGMAITVHRRTHIGFQIKNLNNPGIGLDEEELRQRLVAGVSYEPYEGVTTTFEFNNGLGEELQYRGGLEMLIAEGFFLRAGIVTGPNKLTGGFGYAYEDIGVHYGFATGGGVLDNTHHFGLSYAWGGEAQ